jgi:hypothetical protein
MGTWAIDPFGNDTANDWAYELEECDDLSLIENTLDKVLEVGSDYLDADDAAETIAAIEVLARLQGNWSERNVYTEKVDLWVERVKQKPSAALIKKAQRVIKRILSSDSELFELWEESEDFAAWKSSVKRLQQRVNA